eukprot:COSAG05_NODE_3064_length_2365_cov_13.284201_1_plen_71_part_00
MHEIRYQLMGAQNCWGLSCVLFMLMASLAFLYEDEVTIIKEFDDSFKSQVKHGQITPLTAIPSTLVPETP